MEVVCEAETMHFVFALCVGLLGCQAYRNLKSISHPQVFYGWNKNHWLEAKGNVPFRIRMHLVRITASQL